MPAKNSAPPEVRILVARLSDHQDQPSLWQHFDHLSSLQVQEVQKFFREEDRIRGLLGKLALRTLLMDFGFAPELIREIRHSSHGRPELPIDLDFNISHSGEYVLCAASRTCRLGIDVERQREVPLRDFSMVMNDGQWQIIRAAANPHAEFYRWWAIKESVVKADGRGISNNLAAMELEGDTMALDGTTWHLSPLHLEGPYAACLATDLPAPDISMRDCRFE